jgi:cell division ATPase FtsA
MKVRRGEPLFVTSDSDDEVKHGDYATVVGLLMQASTGKEPVIIEEPVAIEQVIFEPDSMGPIKEGKQKKQRKQEEQKEPRPPKPSWTNVMGDIFNEFFKTDNGS